MSEKCGNCGAPMLKQEARPLPENPTSYDKYYTYWGAYMFCSKDCGYIKLVK